MTDLAALTAWSVLTHVWDGRACDWQHSTSYHGSEVIARKYARQAVEIARHCGGLRAVTLLTHDRTLDARQAIKLHACRIVETWRIDEGTIQHD